MPVTAKLSQAFYDRLGHPVADEMVEWFNQVDAAYRTDLRELNELNFARFDARLDLRLERRFAESELAFEHRFSALERQIAKLALDMKEQQVVQMRWMIGMWMVVLVAVIGLSFRR